MSEMPDDEIAIPADAARRFDYILIQACSRIKALNRPICEDDIWRALRHLKMTCAVAVRVDGADHA